jgi:hypothetical protein
MTNALKPAKLAVFDGTDVTHVMVRNWMFGIQEYMDLAEIPETKQTRLAGTYLSGVAKSWYINKYAEVSPCNECTYIWTMIWNPVTHRSRVSTLGRLAALGNVSLRRFSLS